MTYFKLTSILALSLTAISFTVAAQAPIETLSAQVINQTTSAELREQHLVQWYQYQKSQVKYQVRQMNERIPLHVRYEIANKNLEQKYDFYKRILKLES